MSNDNGDLAEFIGNLSTFCTMIAFLSGFQICYKLYKLYKSGTSDNKISSFPIISTIVK